MYFLGDVHQKYTQLNAILETNSPIIQVGDLGFFYPEWLDEYDFRFIGGNHDQWDILTVDPPKSYLGRFGYLEQENIFFISGAFSIDWQYRMQQEYTSGQKTYFSQEQLSWKEGVDMLNLYGKIKPDMVVSHTCPREVANAIGSPGILAQFGFDPTTFTTSTQELLQQAFEIHQPKLWVFGHFHRNRTLTINNTKFVCLAENQIKKFGV